MSTYREVAALPKFAAPEMFAREFNPTDGKPADNIGWHCNLFLLNCHKESVISSPLFPHRILKSTEIDPGSCSFRYRNNEEANLSREGRYLHIDPFWRVFWVEITQCREKTRFYGPYRW